MTSIWFFLSTQLILIFPTFERLGVSSGVSVWLLADLSRIREIRVPRQQILACRQTSLFVLSQFGPHYQDKVHSVDRLTAVIPFWLFNNSIITATMTVICSSIAQSKDRKLWNYPKTGVLVLTSSQGVGMSVHLHSVFFLCGGMLPTFRSRCISF